MAIKTTHKKRGSTLSLVVMLVLLLALGAAIILWPVESKAMTPTTTTEQSPEEIEATNIVKLHDLAPDFTVQMLDGTRYTLSDLTAEGKVVMITFWATWCPPCRQELSHMQKAIFDRYKGTDLVVLPISRGEEPNKVRSLLDKMGITFNVGLDQSQDIYRLYASNYIPRTYIIDRNGRVAYFAVGYDDEVAKQTHDTLDELLLKK